MVNALDGLRSAAQDGLMPDTDLARLLLQAHRLLTESSVSTLVEWGWEDAKSSDAALFMHIDRRSGSRITELARDARITKQGMMLITDDLERRGYVRRVPDPDDARAKLVRLTARGRRYVADGRRVAAATETRIRRDLGYRSFASLRSSLDYLRGEEPDWLADE